ncbi:hypothetical protein NX059_012213 [Plenodomus lindquistii]|nr:hypothetical protein NX059_012213 [Plenodomus lindquistii]
MEVSPYDSQPVLQPARIPAAVPSTRLDANVNAPTPLSNETQQALWKLYEYYKQKLESLLKEAFNSVDLPWLVPGWPEWKVELWVSSFRLIVEDVVAGSRLLRGNANANNYGFRALSQLRHEGQTKLSTEVADQLQKEWDHVEMRLFETSLTLHSIHVRLELPALTFLPQRLKDWDEAGLTQALCLSLPRPTILPVPMLGAHLLKRRDALVQPYKDWTLDRVREFVGQNNFPEFVRAWMRGISITLRPQDMDFFVNADPFTLGMPLAMHVLKIQLCINTDASLACMPALKETTTATMDFVAQLPDPQGCTVFIDVFRSVPGHSNSRVAFHEDGLDAASRMMHFLARGCFSALPDKLNELLVELRIWRCSKPQRVPASDFLWLQRSTLATLSIRQWRGLAKASAAKREKDPNYSSDDATSVPYWERLWINQSCSKPDYFPYPDGYGIPRHITLTDRTSPT